MSESHGRIPEDFIKTLLARIDIIDVVNSRVSLRKNGNNFVACCPFHQEKTPSFSVNQSKQFYHCFGCGVSGDAIQFVIEHDSVGFVEAVESLAAQAGMIMPTLEKDAQFAEHNLIYTILTEATAFYEQQLRQQTLAKHAVQYLKQRGLSGITAKAFRLGFAPPGWDNLLQKYLQSPEQKEAGIKAGLFITKEGNKCYDRFRNRVMFPIRNRRGQVIGFGARVIDSQSNEPKYLNSPETPVFNKSQELYGLYEARQEIQKLNSIVVVEGYMDVVSLAQAGITNVVATLGTACTEQHVQQLFKLAAEIIFCFDGDAAGKKAAWRSLELCLPLLDDKHTIKFLILNGNEDPDSFVRKHGANAMQAEIKRAISVSDYLFSTLAKQLDLQTIDGRMQLANQAKQYILKLSNELLKSMLFDRLGQMIDVDPAILRDQDMSKVRDLKVFKQTVITRKKLKPLLAPASKALALLLVQRDLIGLITPEDFKLCKDLPGATLLFAVVELLQREPQINEYELTKHLPEDLGRAFLPDELRAVTRIVPKHGYEQEFQDILALLRRLAKDQIMDGLLLKARQDVLSPADKLLLQQMLQEKDKN